MLLQKCLSKASWIQKQASSLFQSTLQKFLRALRLQQTFASFLQTRKSARWKYFFMQKAMLIAVIAKKKPAWSCSITCTRALFRFRKRRINCRERTPPPRKSVSGYWPWNPSLIHSFPERFGGSLKYSLQRDSTRSHLSWCSKRMLDQVLRVQKLWSSSWLREQSSQKKHYLQCLEWVWVGGSEGSRLVSAFILLFEIQHSPESMDFVSTTLED